MKKMDENYNNEQWLEVQSHVTYLPMSVHYFSVEYVVKLKQLVYVMGIQTPIDLAEWFKKNVHKYPT